MAQRHKQQRRARIVRIVVTLASVVAIVWFLFLRNSIPNAIAGHELEDFDTFASESRANQLHTTDPVTYTEVPPVSGQHSPNPADCGVYGEPIPNENMVHTLEHGSVGILYQPDAPVEEVREAESIVQEFDSHAFSAPYEGLEDPYTIVAWAHLMRLDSFDREAVVEFFDVFRQGGDAPESTPCLMNSDEPFQPTPTGSPTPTPGETPDEGADGDNENEGGAGGGKGNDKKEKKKD